jgi:hypothetical protein
LLADPDLQLALVDFVRARPLQSRSWTVVASDKSPLSLMGFLRKLLVKRGLASSP